MTLTLKFDLLLKNLYFLWQDLSQDTVIFDLVTLKFDLLLKNFNLGHNFLTRKDGAFILHMCIPCDKTFHIVPQFFNLVTLTLKFDLLLKNFNHGFYLVMVAAWRALLSSDNSYFCLSWCLHTTYYYILHVNLHQTCFRSDTKPWPYLFILQILGSNPMFAGNPQLQQQMQAQMPAMLEQVCNYNVVPMPPLPLSLQILHY